MNGKPGSWWNSISLALLSEAGALGAYLDKSGLTLVQVQKGFSGSRITNLARLTRSGDDPDSWAARVEEAISLWGLANSPVSLAVSRDMGFFREVTLPAAAADNLAQVVSYELDRFLPLPGARLYYGFQVLEETDTGIRLMLLALPREPVEECLNLLSRVGLRPISLEPGPVAVANAFSLLGGKLPPSWLLLHLETDRLELTQIQGKTLSFSKQVRLTAPQKPGDSLAAEIRRLEEAGSPPKALALYGQAAAEPGILAVARQENLTVITPGNFTIKGLPPEKDLETAAFPALGAALRGLGKVPVGTNLLPPEERTVVRLSGFSLNKLLLLVFLSLVVVWVGSMFVHKRVLLYQVDQELVRVTPDARLVEKQMEESRALAKQLENLRRLEKSPDKLSVLKDLTQLIPDHTWLFNLRISQQNLEIGGMSRSAADLIPLLEKSGWLKKTEFASPIVTDASKLEHFKIKAEIKGLELAP